MNTATKSLIFRGSIIILFGLVFSLPAVAHGHGYGSGYWRPHGYYGWQRPYYPPPMVYAPVVPRYAPVPPPVVYGAPPVYRLPPVWHHPYRYGWR